MLMSTRSEVPMFLVPPVHQLIVRMLVGVPATIVLIATLVTVGTYVANRKGWKS